MSHTALLPLSGSTVLSFTSEKHSYSMDSMCCMGIKHSVWGLEATYNTRLRGPHDSSDGMGIGQHR